MKYIAITIHWVVLNKLTKIYCLKNITYEVEPEEYINIHLKRDNGKTFPDNIRDWPINEQIDFVCSIDAESYCCSVTWKFCDEIINKLPFNYHLLLI